MNGMRSIVGIVERGFEARGNFRFQDFRFQDFRFQDFRISDFKISGFRFWISDFTTAMHGMDNRNDSLMRRLDLGFELAENGRRNLDLKGKKQWQM